MSEKQEYASLWQVVLLVVSVEVLVVLVAIVVLMITPLGDYLNIKAVAQLREQGFYYVERPMDTRQILGEVIGVGDGEILFQERRFISDSERFIKFHRAYITDDTILVREEWGSKAEREIGLDGIGVNEQIVVTADENISEAVDFVADKVLVLD
ncbi:hypothetical protein MYX07_03940 [Patescibacteria group bacterium AH-259-L07]|nr:hypothetical protein [Patescibacteria group bacterium AH-259-L07]